MRGEKIMLVDDNKEFLDELRETLFLCGYEPIAVAESKNALKIARKRKPDVILLDLNMAHKNGFEVAEELKYAKETAAIPIIAMSGYYPIEQKGLLLDTSNMEGHIKKPFSVIDLIGQIENALGALHPVAAQTCQEFS